jgi:mannosyltransferase
MKDLLKSTKFYIVLAVLIGICVRLYGLDIQGLWFDEAVSLATASTHTLQAFLHKLSIDFHPPLYPIFLYFWVKIFGTTEIALRLPSAIAGILTLFPMYFLSKKVFNKYIATSATILTSFSCAAVLYSQEMRDYSFLLFFSALSTLLWLNILKKVSGKGMMPTEGTVESYSLKTYFQDISWKELWIYGLACIVTLYTHYFGILLISCQFVYLLSAAFIFKKVNSIRKIVLLSFVLFLLFLPWYNFFLHSARGLPDLSEWLNKPNFASLICLTDFVFNKKLIILLFIPVLLKIKNLKFDILLSGLLYLLIIPVITVFLMARFSSLNYFFPRYFMIIIPSAYLIISILLTESLNGITSNIFVFIVSFVSLLLFLFVPGNNFLNPDYTFYGPYKQQWREVQKYVSEKYRQDSAILLDRNPEYFSYYFNRFNKTNIKYNVIICHDSMLLNSEAIKLRKNKKVKRIFIISDYVKIPQRTITEIEAQHAKCSIKSFTQVYLYDCRFD